MGKVEDALASMARNLEANTGKSLDAWTRIARQSGAARHGEILAWLKREHGLGHGYANLIAGTTLKAAGADDAADPVAAQYAGAKSALRPLYEALVVAVQRFGSDVELAPKKTYVSVRRRKQFAILQASTAQRLDVGLNLKGVAPTPRLEASGSFSAMVTHRVRLGVGAKVDKELVGWLKHAYDEA